MRELKEKTRTSSAESGLDKWIIKDLEKSGLTLEDFPVIPLKNEEQLKHYLGFTTMDGVRIIDVEGYFIPYPNVEGFFRLKLRNPIGDCRYLSPKKERGLGNHPYILQQVFEVAKDFKPDKPLIFTEGEKKTVCGVKHGFNVIGISGVWCFKDSESDFLQELNELNSKYRKCYINFDSDIVHKHNVRHAELRLAVEFINRGGVPLSVRLPNKPNDEKNGLDDFLVRYGKEQFQELLEKAKPTFELHLEEKTHTDLIIKEIARINSIVEREQIIKQIATYKKVSVEVIRSEVEKHQLKTEEKTNVEAEKFTEEEKQKALKLLQSPDFLNKVNDITEKAGYVGEEVNKKMLYLSFTSRLLDDTISCVVKGVSSSGKSALVKSILSLFPKDAYMEYSFITPKALLHTSINLNHKILCIYEHAGSQSADYSLRTALSERELSILIPIKNEVTGNFESIEKRIPAEGMVFVETTTKEVLHYENQTRMFDFFMDESPEQTRRILEAEARGIENKEALKAELQIWKAAQASLEPFEVVIPFVSELAKAFPTNKVRVRRDFKRFLALIKAHALLYQNQRERTEDGRLIAIVEDFRAILPLAEVVLTQSLKEISPKKESVLKVICEKFPYPNEFSLGDLIPHVKEVKIVLTDRTLKSYLSFFNKSEFLEWNGKLAKESRYSLIASFSVDSLSLIPQYTQLIENIEKDWGTSLFSPNFPNSPNRDEVTSEPGFWENGENKEKNNFSPIKSNDSNKLDEKKGLGELGKQGLEKHIRREIKQVRLSDGRVGYEVTEHAGDRMTVYLVYPEDTDYAQVQKDYFKSQSRFPKIFSNRPNNRDVKERIRA